MSVQANAYETNPNVQPPDNTTNLCESKSNPCLIYIVPEELVLEDIEVEGQCRTFDLLPIVSGGGWKLIGNDYRYKNYTWKAFDVNNLDEEIDIFNPSSNNTPGSIQVNLEHSYFQQFRAGSYAEFFVKLVVEDYANNIVEKNQLIAFDPFRINLDDEYTRCPGVSSAFSLSPLVSGGTNNYSYSWSTSSGSLDFESNDPEDPNPVFMAPASGNKVYDLIVDMLDASGMPVCSLSKQITVTATPLLLELPNLNWSVCTDGEGQIGLTEGIDLGGSGTYSYEWTSSDPVLGYLSDVYSPIPTVSDFPTGNSYTYTLTATDAYGGCTSSDAAEVTGIVNDHQVTLPASMDLCFREGTILKPTVSPIENNPPFGDLIHHYYWTTTNQNQNLTGLGLYTKELQVNEIASSLTWTHTYTLRYENSITGCFAEASTNITVGPIWRHVGYVPKVKFAIDGSTLPLWDDSDNNIMSGLDLSQISVIWDPYPPSTVTNNGTTVLPKNGTFVPTKDVPYLTMTVVDNTTGCTKSYKTVKYVILDEEPKINIYTDTVVSGYKSKRIN
ncbi:MAG: hypothetical protein H6576_13910 [Lewinellaceae bacterium]|nr:hypothetical protein [Lewinellaceae bacterium]